VIKDVAPRRHEVDPAREEPVTKTSIRRLTATGTRMAGASIEL